MPTYDYRCAAGHEFERFFRKISDAVAEVPCPECGATAERRVSAGAGLLFKGSGFYITDYGKDGKGPKKPAETTTGDATPAGGDVAKPTSESKPAEPKPAKGEETKPKPAKKDAEKK